MHSDSDSIRRMRNLLRVVMSLALGGVLAWVISEARSEFATLGTVEGAKQAIIGAALFFLLALWMPWRPLRILAAALLLAGPALGGLAGVFILAGGPDSRGPQDGGIFVVLLVVVALVCVPMVVFIICEWQLASHERREPPAETP